MIRAQKEVTATIVTKTYGNIILMTVICVVIFWIFMAIRPAAASWRLIPGDTTDRHFHGCGSSWQICAERAAARARANAPNSQKGKMR
jgi:hypothetical protein